MAPIKERFAELHLPWNTLQMMPSKPLTSKVWLKFSKTMDGGRSQICGTFVQTQQSSTGVPWQHLINHRSIEQRSRLPRNSAQP